MAELYLAGMNHYQRAEWRRAVTAFKPVYEQDPTYLHVDEILYSAYFNLGAAQEAPQSVELLNMMFDVGLAPALSISAQAR